MLNNICCWCKEEENASVADAVAIAVAGAAMDETKGDAVIV